jgi:hypothetical protein
VDHLVNTFKEEGCRRLDPDNYMTVMTTRVNFRPLLNSLVKTGQLPDPGSNATLEDLDPEREKEYRALCFLHQLKTLNNATATCPTVSPT